MVSGRDVIQRIDHETRPEKHPAEAMGIPELTTTTITPLLKTRSDWGTGSIGTYAKSVQEAAQA
jgi:hypothetical protein